MQSSGAELLIEYRPHSCNRISLFCRLLHDPNLIVPSCEPTHIPQLAVSAAKVEALNPSCRRLAILLPKKGGIQVMRQATSERVMLGRSHSKPDPTQ